MLKNRTSIKVKGLNQERALNNISKTIKIYNYKRQEHNLGEFEVDVKFTKKITKLIEKEGLEVVDIKNKGLLYNFFTLFKRFGIIAGLVFVVLFYVIQYNFVLKIEVWGGSTTENAQVKEFVQKNMPGNFKNNIQTEELEVLVRNNFDFVSSVSIAIVGQSIIVNLNPSVLPDEMQGKFQPLVSDYDGLIKEINLVQGTLNCEVGDIVQKGDILVMPYILDSNGTLYEVQPSAEIIADVWLNASVSHYDYKIVQYRTGRSVTISEVLLGDKVIYNNTHDIDFKDYECETYSQNLTDILLPFVLRKTIYYEIETEEIFQDFDEVKSEIISQAREKALIFFDKNDIIIDENYSISEGAGCHIVNYTISVQKNIGGNDAS